MAESNDLIDFNVIESQKENIQALPSGRSAKALAQLYSPPLLQAHPSPALSEAHIKARAGFEKELANIDEADDPLEVYDRYVKWTLNAYPSAQATPQSQLLPLLERATKTFQSSSHYKNDPRYLRLWLQYIQLFSDAPRETFVFLARHGIGDALALYYEELAAWLENAGRWNQAEEIYKMGLEKEARPLERLTRKFGEFERRYNARPQDATEPSSPALPTVRPALAAKLDPFASTSPSSAPQQSRSSTTKKSKSSKMAVFADDDAQPRPDSGSSSKGWDSIGSIADRKKENSVAAKPWAGEKLKVGKTNGGMEKLMVFKDQTISMPKHLITPASSRAHESQWTYNAKTGRMECVFVDLEAVYPEVGDMSVEYCFEELRAKRRGWDNQQWRKRKAARQEKSETVSLTEQISHEPLLDLSLPEVPEILHTRPEPKTRDRSFKIFEDETAEPAPESQQPNQKIRKQRGFQIFTDSTCGPEPSERQSANNGQGLGESFPKTLALNDENDENSRPRAVADVDLAKKARKEERANRTRKIKVMDVQHIKNETKTIQLNMDSPSGPKLKRKKSAGRPEPTMTINTKEAMDEIYGIFSQPLESQNEQADAEEAEDSESDDDDYTTGDESTATGRLSAPASEYGDETRNELLGGTVNDPDRTNVTGWSDFTTSKHVPKDSADEAASGPSTTHDVYTDDQSMDRTGESLIDPMDDENPRTRYIPMPPEDYEPPVAQFRDLSMIPNHRLPFMTPIVEQTESSIGIATTRTDKSFAGTKTPSRNTGMPDILGDDDYICSSPFDEVTADLDEDKRRVLQPIRTKSTKGTLALGHGTAKSQIYAKAEVRLDDSHTESVQKGPLIKDDQCNPMDPFLRETILAHMRPSLTTYEGYHEHLDVASGRSAEIKKFVRAQAKNSQTPSGPPMVDLVGAQGSYVIKRELGAGTFAPVYLAENSAMTALKEDEEDVENRAPLSVGKAAHRKALEAIKMEEPVSSWEFYILRQCHRRLGVSRAVESIVRAHEMHVYSDECFLVEEFRDQGTLLDLVNIARLESGSGGGMDEMLAMFFTVELLRVTEAMHAKQLIHGDLKGDNVLVRLDEPGMETDWSPTYFPSGTHGWSSKGVCLIDFGRGIDMKHFIPNVAFIADWKTTDADCAEMRELRPWTYQIDYHGLAGIIHSLLFGKYMETVSEKSGGLGAAATRTHRIRESLKRYWQTDIWNEVFRLLLNPLACVEAEDGGKMPVLRGMRACRESMEAWLEENCERGVGLKGMVSRMECAVRERRRKNKAG